MFCGQLLDFGFFFFICPPCAQVHAPVVPFHFRQLYLKYCLMTLGLFSAHFWPNSLLPSKFSALSLWRTHLPSVLFAVCSDAAPCWHSLHKYRTTYISTEICVVWWRTFSFIISYPNINHKHSHLPCPSPCSKPQPPPHSIKLASFMGPRGAHCTASTSTAGRLREGSSGQIWAFGEQILVLVPT